MNAYFFNSSEPIKCPLCTANLLEHISNYGISTAHCFCGKDYVNVAIYEDGVYYILVFKNSLISANYIADIDCYLTTSDLKNFELFYNGEFYLKIKFDSAKEAIDKSRKLILIS